MSAFTRNLRELRRYPTAIVGLLLIFGLIIISIYTLITIPYGEAVRLWRGGEDVWDDTPRHASPVWTNWFSREKRVETIVLDSAEGDTEKVLDTSHEEFDEVTMEFNIDYHFDTFPPELILFLEAQFAEKAPFVSLTWITPDGREIRIADVTPKSSDSYRFAQDSKLERRLGGLKPEIGLFMDPNSDPAAPVPLKGTYTLIVDTLLFEENSDIDTKMVVFGEVYGLAGTDHRRRDLMVALLWGTPIALSFGLVAAVIISLSTMFIAATGVWFGGVVDSTIQRITEVNLILPLLPILIMVGTFYSTSIWRMLGLVIVLSIFGGAIKTYRAIFLQVRESPYIEAAQAYGSSNSRIIFRYLIPRILPLILPNLVILVPTFVFLEASLAVLGLGDPVLPTWGKIIRDANAEGALFSGQYYWILEPAALLMIAGLSFALVGFALDRIFNPRLREI